MSIDIPVPPALVIPLLSIGIFLLVKTVIEVFT